MLKTIMTLGVGFAIGRYYTIAYKDKNPNVKLDYHNPSEGQDKS